MPLKPHHRPGWKQKLAAAAQDPAAAVRYVRAQVRHAAAGRPKRTPQGQAEAWEMCLRCEHFQPRTQRCGAKGCGCFLTAKIPMATEACPEGHWPAERSADAIADAVLTCLACPLRSGWTCSVAGKPLGALVADRYARCPTSPPKWTEERP